MAGVSTEVMILILNKILSYNTVCPPLWQYYYSTSSGSGGQPCLVRMDSEYSSHAGPHTLGPILANKTRSKHRVVLVVSIV